MEVQEMVVKHQSKTREENDTVVQMIVFNLGEEEEFVADIDQVREILQKRLITPIPDSPEFIRGVINVRGEIAVVIDLKRLFALPFSSDEQDKHIIIAEQNKNLFGLMVDEVTEVLRLSRSEIKPTPELVTKIDRVYISGVIVRGDRLIIMLDLLKLLSDEDLKKLHVVPVKHKGVEDSDLTVQEKIKETVQEQTIEEFSPQDTTTKKGKNKRKTT